MIDKLEKLINLCRSDVICIGCRNTNELDYFRGKGVRSVIGIDLWSVSDDIRIMDMHEIRFPDSTFDIVYCSHCLEHSLDPEKAIREFIRIVRKGGAIVVEVPVNYDGRKTGADLHDFKSVNRLLALFDGSLDTVLWKESGQPLDAGNDVIRAIIRVKK